MPGIKPTTRRATGLTPDRINVVIQRLVTVSIDAADIERWVTATLSNESGELTVRIVDADESAALNGRYRDKHYATNVLSFPADPLPVELEDEDAPFGDLVLCAPVIASEAVEQGKTLTAHWAHLLVHGCLHLKGFDHETAAEAATMEALERDLLGKLGFADPYATE
jgi:probable rRNA maturation factor